MLKHPPVMLALVGELEYFGELPLLECRHIALAKRSEEVPTWRAVVHSVEVDS